ncbi:hypothetical protein B0H12DRAFT_689709 [Mycena haematopus]|nr:hypothetical protein B0H12DRAFT_689709 [Mycena haematopus]
MRMRMRMRRCFRLLPRHPSAQAPSRDRLRFQRWYQDITRLHPAHMHKPRLRFTVGGFSTCTSSADADRVILHRTRSCIPQRAREAQGTRGVTVGDQTIDGRLSKGKTGTNSSARLPRSRVPAVSCFPFPCTSPSSSAASTSTSTTTAAHNPFDQGPFPPFVHLRVSGVPLVDLSTGKLCFCILVSGADHLFLFRCAHLHRLTLLMGRSTTVSCSASSTALRCSCAPAHGCRGRGRPGTLRATQLALEEHRPSPTSFCS